VRPDQAAAAAPDRPGAGTVSEPWLRPACAADAAAIAAIHVVARRQVMPYLPELHTEDEVRAWVAGSLLPNAAVWVALIDGAVAGYMACSGSDLDHLYVAPHCQGRGLGSLLSRKAKELSPEGLELDAFQRNRRARAFYEARGFAAVAFSDGAGNAEREPHVRYAWPGRA
jgi:ribosomal protein S18 acetylase RimI-like enzyme